MNLTQEFHRTMEIADTRIDRYPGPKPYDESLSSIFFGRTQEIKDLLDAIVVNQTLLIHGESGLGKSSLINAGLIPRLRKEGYSPFLFRFKDRDIPPLDNILLELFHIEPELELTTEVPAVVKLWLILKKLNQQGLHPVLIIDQFEEFSVFTSNEQIEFYDQLSTLSTRRMMSISPTLTDLLSAEELDAWYSPLLFRLVVSIRSDKLNVMEELGQHIPDLFKNRYKLKAISFNYAKQLILLPAVLEDDNTIRFKTTPFGINDEVTANILDVIKDANQIIETTQLQMICQDIEVYVRSKSWDGQAVLVTESDYSLERIQSISRNFYQNQLKKLEIFAESKDEYKAVRVLIEQRMLVNEQKTPLTALSIKEHFDTYFTEIRNRQKFDMVPGITSSKYQLVTDVRLEKIVNYLLELRVIRDQPYGSKVFYEISHDVLIPGILEKAQEYRSGDEKTKSKRRLRIWLFSFTILYLVIAGIIILWYRWYHVNRNLRAVTGQNQANIAANEYKDGLYVKAFHSWRKASLEYGYTGADSSINKYLFPVLYGDDMKLFNSGRFVAIVSLKVPFRIFDISQPIPKQVYQSVSGFATNYLVSPGGRFIFSSDKSRGNQIIDIKDGQRYPIKLIKHNNITRCGFFGDDSYFYYQYDKGYSFYALPGNTVYDFQQIEKISRMNPIQSFIVSADGSLAYIDNGKRKYIYNIFSSKTIAKLPLNTIGFNFHRKQPVYYYIVNRTKVVVVNYRTGWQQVLSLKRPSFIDEIEDRLIVKNPQAFGRIAGVGVNYQYSYVINTKSSTVYTIPKRYYSGNITGLSSEKYFLFKKMNQVFLVNRVAGKQKLLDQRGSNCLTDNERNLVYYTDSRSQLNIYHLNTDIQETLPDIKVLKFVLNKNCDKLAFQQNSSSRVGILNLTNRQIRYLPVEGSLDKFIGKYVQVTPLRNIAGASRILLDPETALLKGSRKIDYLEKLLRKRND